MTDQSNADELDVDSSASNTCDANPEFLMTCPRLSLVHLLVVAIASCAILGFLPRFWSQNESSNASGNYRIPFDLSEDYWVFQRVTEQAARDSRIPVIGDSVIWGEYTLPAQSLTAHLNRLAGQELFLNAGLNGLHPLAIEGLTDHFFDAEANQRVILHCNLLWMSSPLRDLSSTEVQTFNHEQLVRQFSSSWPFFRSPVRCYGADASERLRIAIQRHLPYRTLVAHVRKLYLDGNDLHRWTLSNPNALPWRGKVMEIPSPEQTLRHPARPWFESIEPQSSPWVEPVESLQWAAFMRTVERLARSHVDVAVVVGPLNQHLMTSDSRQRFEAIRQQVVNELEHSGVTVIIPKLLESELYADASHPLAAGYRVMAANIWEQDAFQSWLR